MNFNEAMDKADAAIVSLLPPPMSQSFKAMREQQKARDAEALATKNEEVAKAIESLAQALQSRYARHDIESAMQALNRAHAAALVVDPLEAA